MNDDPRSTHTHGQRSWLEQLSHFLLREPKDREQLVELLHDAEQRELLDADALRMIEGVLQVSELQARDIMIPRAQMVVVEHDQTPEQFLPIITESAHSRFPVIGENRDEVIGILLAKDLLPYTFNGNTKPFDIHDILRPTQFIPESKRLDVLLKEFRLKRNHMAIVADEYGGVAGLVTIEDVLEQIVGEIEDEYDTDTDHLITQQSKQHYLVNALTPIEDFNQHFKAKLDEEEFDTIGGLIGQAFGRLPKRGETIEMGGLEFKVVSADARRLRMLQVTAKPST